MTTENRSILKKTLIASLALALVQKLNVAPQDNLLSQHLNGQADQLVKEMSQLSSAAFDRLGAENELGYEGP